jgi:hypothetical protein
MKYIVSFVAFTILLLSQETNSFSTTSTSSGLFQRTNPSTTTTRNRQHTERQRRRNEFPFATSIRPTSTTTSLSVATPAVAAITGVLTGGILGGALHAIAGKFFLFVSRHKMTYRQTDLHVRNTYKKWVFLVFRRQQI